MSRIHRYLFTLILVSLCSFGLQAQSISGVVNDYAQVTNINANDITVASAANFSAGDRVMLIQMKGASIVTTNTTTYGDIVNLNDAGNYEFATIGSISGNVISLLANPCQTYDPTGRVQLVRVFTATNATVTGALNAQAWNGVVGGVLVLEVSNTLTLNANIDVSEDGFRGGTFTSGGFSCGDNAFASGGNLGGGKGEGIADFVASQINSRGKQANGGGGSNRGNSGAGGGGNGGAGGGGGFMWSGCNSNANTGIGGLAPVQNNGKAFLGGGGGGGFRDNGQNVTGGARGGGIVYIVADQIIGNGNSILSNGGTVTGVTNDEGSGAAGAGGSILLDINTYTGTTNITANGGNGGNTFNNIFTNNCHGPGGGGGGGIVWFTQAAAPAGATITTNGGNSGLVTNPNQPCFNQPHGATNGSNGQSLFNLSAPGGITVFLGNDSTLCDGDTLVLAPGAFNTYTWSDASTADTLEVTTSGQYAVTVTSGCGSAIDTINLTFVPNPSPQLGADTTICAPNSVTLNPGTYSSYTWQDNTTNPTLTATTAGQYIVTVTDAAGCTGADTLNLSVNAQPTVNISGNLSYCQNDSTLLDAGAGFTNYAWNTGPSSQTIYATFPGSFQVTVTDVNGCVNADTVLVNLNALPPLNLGGNQTVCDGTPVLLDAGPGLSAYSWSDNSTGQTLSPTTSGTYIVTITDANGCQNIDSSIVTFNPNPVPNLGNDTSICTGSNISFNPGTGFASYTWQDNSSQPFFIAVQAGNYSVTVTNTFGCSASDDINLSLLPLPTPDLGGNFELCAGNVPISPDGGPYSGYLWQDGSTASSFNVTGPGAYSVTVTDGDGCQGVDNITVVNGVTSVDLGNDTIICDGDNITLATGPGYTGAVWSDGSTGFFLTVGAVGTYSVTVTDSIGCQASDDMEILSLVPYPSPDFGPDTILCANSTLTLDAGPADSYNWSTGETTQSITIGASPGLYQVTVTSLPGCTTVEGILILNNIPLPLANLGNDRRFCAGDSTIFDSGNPFANMDYIWSTGETTPTITAFTEGTYSVTVSNVCGTATSSADVLPLIFPPVPDLGPDTSMCDRGETIDLDAGVAAPTYLWANGSIDRFQTAFHPGVYAVTASNQCGSNIDSIVIALECEPALYWPDAFTPNGDMMNDGFGPVGEAVEDFELNIFDRWGKLIYQTNDQNAQWAGNISGQPVPEGVYVWTANYRYTFRGETKDFRLSGSVTLYR